MDVWMLLLGALLPTIVIEWCVLLLLGERRRRVLLGSVALNIVTNMALNMYLVNSTGNWFVEVAIGEVLVIVAETIGYCCLSCTIRQSVVYSTLCNAVSFLTGLLFQLIWMLV
jgi:hypothetical protein